MGINDTRTLHLVGDDATHKVGCGVAKRCHEVVKGLLVEVCHGDKLAALPFAFTCRASEEGRKEEEEEEEGGRKGREEDMRREGMEWNE